MKIEAYFERYVPFFDQFRTCDLRLADRALFIFGKFLKNSEFPDIAEWNGQAPP